MSIHDLSLHTAWLAIVFLCAWQASPTANGAETERPNVIYIMADELGYYEPSYMGNRNIQTPNLDRFAAEGIRFTNCMAGSSVCAPTRCCFLTGKHSGHTSVRSNGGGTPLRSDEQTIASILKPLGYATGGFGKWGNGGRGSTGVPEAHGFDLFVGYYDQVHAHSYYPPYILRNSQEMPLAGNKGNSEGETYSHYVIMEEAFKFIRENKSKPFFCYLPVTPPHGNFDIPDTDAAWQIYKDKPWPESARRYAAMVTMLDRQLGELLAMLQELNLDEKTLVMFSGDNGGADYFASAEYPRGFHSANKHPQTGVEFRGKKGNLYEGGLRVPAAARWPGKIAPNQVSDLLWYFPDVLPTIAEVVGAQPPADIDGMSIVPELLGATAAGRAQPQHEYLYWEISGQTAVRAGTWRAVQPKPNAAWELYDLAKDPSESVDVAMEHPEQLKRLQAFARQAHTPAVEGTFTSTELHERDRAAKFGGKPPAKKGSRKKQTSFFPGVISNEKWNIVRASSENTSNGKYAANAIDGDPSTLWHSKFSGEPAKLPHELVIDLGDKHKIQGFHYLARQDGGWNGAVKDVEFYVSDSPEEFKAPVAKASLEKTREVQTVACSETHGRFVLMRIHSEHTAGKFATVAELAVIGE